jgi:hypothetical protein
MKYEVCDKCTNKDKCPLAMLAKQNERMLAMLKTVNEDFKDSHSYGEKYNTSLADKVAALIAETEGK